MGKVLEVIFDYACPFCYRIHDYLEEQHRIYPDLQFKAVPCEAHPRPELYGKYSDLCVMGMYFCEEHGIDLLTYHQAIYKAIYIYQINYENAKELVGGIKSILKGDEALAQEFVEALTEGRYKEQVLSNNRYAWVDLDLPAVPSLLMEGKLLKAVPGYGITRKQIKSFLDSVS